MAENPKRYFVLLYYVDHTFAERRGPFREPHLKLVAAAHQRGELIHGGALGDPPDRALLLFRSEDRSVAEAFAKADPYVTSGLVQRWEVQPWNIVCGLREGDFDPIASMRSTIEQGAR
jgi:uncharacterized protein